MKNIAIAKYGKSVKFCSPYSPTGGDAEAPHTFQALARLNPDKTFYLIGKSDFYKLKDYQKKELFPYDNVVDCYAQFDKSKGKDRTYVTNYIVDYMERNNLKMDYGIIFIGQIGTVTVPDRIKQLKNPDLIASVIEMSLYYSAALTHYLNTSMLPWTEILTDVRLNSRQTRDIFNPPLLSLGQQKSEYKMRHISSYEDQTLKEHLVTTEYADIEKTICLFYDKPSKESWFNKTGRIVTISNQINDKRYDQHKKWVLDNFNDFDDLKLYGKWEDERALSDDRFKGPTTMLNIQKELRAHKYSIIIPTHIGWVTAKYIEIIGNGCIPFMHPSYDSINNHLDLPDVIRPKTPEELRATILKMEEDDSYRIEILEMLWKRYIKDSFYDGTFINEVIFKKIDPKYTPPDLSLFKKEKLLNLEALFDL